MGQNHQRRWICWPVLSVMLLCVATTTSAQTLFHDDFDNGELDQSSWRLPVGEGTFFGRTQIKPPFFEGEAYEPVITNGVLNLQLDTHNPSARQPGDSFWGHEIQTRRLFAVNSGLSVIIRARYVRSPPSGLVGGLFLYRLRGNVRSEIDFELLSNDLATQRIFTNVFNRENFSQPGNFEHISVPGLQLDRWNVYEIRWFPSMIEWHVNGTPVRTVQSGIPQSKMEVRINLWGPDETFPQAFSASLQPDASPQNNRTFRLQVDYVTVSQLRPDLTVTSPFANETSTTAGQRTKVSASVANVGNGASSPTTLRFFRSRRSDVSAADRLAGTTPVPELAANSTLALEATLAPITALGVHWVIACVTAVPTEQTSTNNCSPARQIQVSPPSVPLAPLIDLIIQSDE